MRFNLVYLPELNNIHTLNAHRLWNSIIRAGDTVIDATCGNGHDSLVLAKKTLTNASGNLYCIDIQQNAIISTQKKLQLNGFNDGVHYICGTHDKFPSSITPQSVSCIAYNLGYLPGSDKTFTTKPHSTLSSIESATKLIKLGGLISVMAYIGHKGGPEETNAVITYMEQLASDSWLLNMYSLENKPSAPLLLTAVKIDETNKNNFPF